MSLLLVFVEVHIYFLFTDLLARFEVRPYVPSSLLLLLLEDVAYKSGRFEECVGTQKLRRVGVPTPQNILNYEVGAVPFSSVTTEASDVKTSVASGPPITRITSGA